jgi:3-oxoacyl-[acyl-carrier protein] reductase
MDLGLKGKVALIGGASKGLGKACAFALGQEGVAVAICAREQVTLEATARQLEKMGIRVLALAADMASKEDNERIVEVTLKKFGRLDILVNNSGGPAPGTFYDFDDSDWEKAFHSVLMYVVRLNRLVIPHMKKNKWGRIINITSLSVKEPAETLILSNVFRSGVVSMAKTMSQELVKHNITINNVCPGAFKTDRAVELMTKAAKVSKTTVDEIEKSAIKSLPQGRFQDPKELGDLVVFLASELAGSITGTTVQIDAGMSKGLL